MFITGKRLFVKQVGCPAYFELGRLRCSGLFELFGGVASLYHFEEFSINEQSTVLIDFPLVWIEPSQRGGDFESGVD